MIITTSLPKGTLNQPYEAAVICKGESGACAWRLVETSQLPAGLGFDPQKGLVAGTPTAVERGVVIVEAYDPSNPANLASAWFSLDIDPTPLVIDIPAAPRGQVGMAYQLTPTVTGSDRLPARR